MATAGGGVTAAGLWWAAQHVRLTLSALGPCGREAVEARPSVVVRPSRLVGGGANHGGGAAEAAAAAAAAATGDGGASWSIAVHIRRGDACERWATRRPKRAPSATKPQPHTHTQPHTTPNPPPQPLAPALPNASPP